MKQCYQRLWLHAPMVAAKPDSHRAEGRGRPRDSPNKMSPAFKQMLLEVAKELGSVPYKDWDKLPCGDGLKGFLKTLAIQDLKAFAMLMCRALPPPPPIQEE
jgi:hypothetical protein